MGEKSRKPIFCMRRWDFFPYCVSSTNTKEKDMSLILDKVSHVYSPGNAYETVAIKDVSLKIEDNEFLGIIGHTGSGKSTLIQHMNGLLTPTSGTIYFNGKDTSEKDFPKKELRSKVGMVFQYPEHQLFEPTVFEDICFGPKNLGLSKEEIDDRVYEALRLVGFPEDLISASPFDLSGGQKRRAAIAGVLAMKPDILILDEPTAGLDPKGRDDILDMIKDMHDKTGNTVVLVSHSMEDIARLVDRIIVMNEGQVQFDDTPKGVYKNYKELEKMGLRAPQITYLMNDLRSFGFDVSTDATTVEEALTEILSLYGKN